MTDSDAANMPAPPAIGFAVASLSLGIIAVFMSFLLVGIVAGLLGLVFGLLQLARTRAGRGMAWWGASLSLVGLLLGGACAGWYYHVVHELRSRGGGDDGPDYTVWHGQPAPELEVTTLDGQTLKLSELKGRRVVLDFWATWCPPCRMEIPHFVELTKENPAEQLLIVGISNEDEETLRAFVQENGVNYPMASKADEDLAEPYSLVRSIPTTFFIDRKGIIQHVEVGYAELEDLRAKALAPDYEAPAPAAD
jgi:peroxiredoxin